MDMEKILKKVRKYIAENPQASKYDYEHQAGPEAEFVKVVVKFEFFGAYREQVSHGEDTITVLARMLEHNIPDGIYSHILERVEEHGKAHLEANVPEADGIVFVHIYDSDHDRLP